MFMLRTMHGRAILAAMLLCVSGTVSAAAPDVFTAPRGGEVYIMGQQQQVHIAKGAFKSNVLVELSTDGGATFTTLGTIPATLKTSPKEFILDFVVPTAASSHAFLQASATTSKGKITIHSQQFVITSSDLSAGVTVADAGVSTPKLADGSVTTPKLADAAVTSTKLGDNSVIAAKLSPKSVTVDKLNSGNASSGFVLLADGSSGAVYAPLPGINNSSVAQNAGIQYSKLNLTNSISTGDIKDGTITDIDISTIAGIQYSKLNLNDSIIGTDIKDGTIGYSKLSLTNSIGSGDLKPDAVTDANVAANAGIQYSKLNLANSIATTDLADGSVTNAKVSPTAAIAYTKLNLNNSIVAGDLTAGSVTLNKINTTGAATGQTLVYNGASLVFSTPAGGGGGNFSLPFSNSSNSATALFDLTNTGDASAGSFTINNNAAINSALVGKTTGTGDGVTGQSATGNAIHGKKTGTDTGVAGLFENTNAANGSDVLSLSNNGAGIGIHSVAIGTGPAGALEVTNTTSTSPALVISHQGTASGVTVNLSNVANSAVGLSVTNAGNTTGATAGFSDGINGTAAGGDGVGGYSSYASGAGVYGQNFNGGYGVLGYNRNSGFGGVTGITDTAGAGVFGYCTASGGWGFFGFGGAQNSNSIAAHFQNINAANTAPCVEILTSSVAPALTIATATGTGGVTAGGTALRVTRGAVALSAANGYTSNATVDNAYLIVTTAGAITLPVAAPLQDGATVWVINNSGGAVSVTNVTSGAVNIGAGNAKQFLRLNLVSGVNWIPVQ